VFAAFGATILEPDLHPRLAEAESLAEFLPHERIGIVRLVEESLELGQLFDGEVGPRSPLLAVTVAVASTTGCCKCERSLERMREISREESLRRIINH